MSPCNRYQVKLLSATNSKVSVEGEREFCYSRASFFLEVSCSTYSLSGTQVDK